MMKIESFDESEIAVLSISGGLDSYILAAYLIEVLGKTRIEGVFLDYGQSNRDVTLSCAKEQMACLKEKFGCVFNLHVIKGFPWHSLGSYVEGIKEETLYSQPERSDEIKRKTFVSGRNSLVALAAMSLADTFDVTEAWMSVQIDPPEWARVQEYLLVGPKDITPQWKDRMNLLAEVSFMNLVRLRTPYLDMRWGKGDIVELGKILSIDLSISYSCRYFPSCGVCQQCIIRQKFLGLSDWKGFS